MRFIQFVVVLGLMLGLSGCGGGGGLGGTASTGTTTGSTTGATTTSTPTITVSLVNAAGTAVTGISLATGFKVRALVKDAAGALVSGKTVTFAISGSSIAALSPSTALTDTSGLAEVTIAPSAVSSVGAATVTATAIVGGTTATGSTDFSVQASSLTLSALTPASANLTSGGTTSVSVTALIGGVAASAVPVNVVFTASCGRINSQDTTSAGVSVTTNGSGNATAIYDAVKADGTLCQGAVTLTASSAGATSVTANITVAAPTASAVTYVSSAPNQIFVAGTGALEQAIVKFKVLDTNGVAMSGVNVKFSISTNPGGVGISTLNSTTPVTASTILNGEASVSVFSGTIPGPVKIRAELAADPTIFAESQNLTVASGPPSQRFMSLSATTYNIEGWGIDGTSTQFTVRVADRQGNPVNDGTVINFTAEGGQVAGSCATAKVNGISLCTVNFISQNPRPVGGRISVLAYAAGTKDYTDTNANNKYDSATDTLTNIGDAYRDDNENGIYDAALGEFVIPRGGTVVCAGTGEPFPAIVNTCDANLETTVRQQAVVMFSSSTPVYTLLSKTATALSFKLNSTTNTLLPMPAGTVISATATDNTALNAVTCTISQVIGSPVPNVNPGIDPAIDLGTTSGLILKDCATGDVITISIKAPSGLDTVRTETVP